MGSAIPSVITVGVATAGGMAPSGNVGGGSSAALGLGGTEASIGSGGREVSVPFCAVVAFSTAGGGIGSDWLLTGA
jgi:hypothetical protein